MADTKFINKITYDGNTLIDLTQDTVTAADVAQGKTLHIASGATVEGTMPTNGNMDAVLNDVIVEKVIPAGHTTGGTVSHVTTTIPKPTVELDKTNGKVTASAEWTKGFTTNTSVTEDLQLSTQAAKTVTPTTSDQVAVAADKYTLGEVKVAGDAALKAENIRDGKSIFNVAGSFSDASTIVGAGQSAVTAGDILTTKSAFINGEQIDGSMPNNGDVSATISTQGGTKVIPAGYTSGGTIKAELPVSELDNTIISGEAFLEKAGDYGWRSTVEIPTGYHESQTLTKEFSNIFPKPSTEGTAAELLLGYQLFNSKGEELTGTMPNNADFSGELTDTVTSIDIPAGYHNGNGTVSHATVDIPDPTMSVAPATGIVTAQGSWTKGFTTDNSYSNTLQLETQATKVVTPTEAAQTAVEAGKYTTGAVSVAAIPSDYVGSSIPRKDSLIVTGDEIKAEAGYYANDATAKIDAGEEGTPTAEKGLVHNHSIDVTPMVTNKTGYIVGHSLTGTPITVEANELVSGTQEITATTAVQDEIDVVNYRYVKVNPTPSETKTVTPTADGFDVTPTSGKLLEKVTVEAVPVNKTENAAGGITVDILPTA